MGDWCGSVQGRNHKEREVTGDETGAGQGRADAEGCRPAKGITFAMENYYLLTGRPLMGDPFGFLVWPQLYLPPPLNALPSSI